MSNLDAVKIKYVGKGIASIPGVPARDMTNDEARQYGITALLKSGLYEIDREHDRPAPKDFDKEHDRSPGREIDPLHDIRKHRKHYKKEEPAEEQETPDEEREEDGE